MSKLAFHESNSSVRGGGAHKNGQKTGHKKGGPLKKEGHLRREGHSRKEVVDVQLGRPRIPHPFFLQNLPRGAPASGWMGPPRNEWVRLRNGVPWARRMKASGILGRTRVNGSKDGPALAQILPVTPDRQASPYPRPHPDAPRPKLFT